MEQGILSAKGRIRRKTFWTRWLIVFVINIALNVIQFTIRDQGIIILTSVVSLLLGIFMIIQGIKRMHDINKSGWYIIIPVYNLILAFTDGTPGKNNYGSDPKGRIKICSNCNAPNDPSANMCDNCGATIQNIAIQEREGTTSDILVLTYIIWTFTMYLIQVLIQKLVPNWYEGFYKYIFVCLNLLSVIPLIMLGLASRNKNYKIIGIILTSVWSAWKIYENIVWLLQEFPE